MVKRLACLLLLLPSCMPEGSGPVTYGDGGADGGRSVEPRDAGLDIDASPPVFDDGGIDAATVPPGENEYAGVDPDAAADRCFNGEDDNEDGTTDCEDPSCQMNVPLCCVGVGSEVCCVTGTPITAPIESCTDGPIDACSAIVQLATPFGASAPYIATFGSDAAVSLVPGGTDNDGGLLFRDTVDPRASAVRIEASIAGPATAHTRGGDVVVLGLTDAVTTADLLRVTPAVALYVSGNRAEVGLVLAGEIVKRWPLSNELFHTYVLSVRPNGTIEVLEDGAPKISVTLPLDRPLRPVIYGRTYNPSASDPAPVRVSAASITADECDVPSALLPPSAPLALGIGPSLDAVTRVAGPSIARWTDGTGDHDRMALEIDGTIYLATRDGDGYALSSALGAPALIGGETWAEERLSDPVLRWTGTTLELWFTAWANGRATIARIIAAARTDSFLWGDVETVLAPTSDVSYAEPSPLEIDGVPHLIVRAIRAGGDQLELHRLGEAPALLSVLRAPSPDDLFAFDRDEVGAPAVIRTGTGWRLFFAGRRGSRWSIGVLVSADGARWREPAGGAFVYDGSHTAFDVLGARDPEPVIEGDTLRLYYAGLDGVHTRIGAAIGAAPPEL